MKLPTIAGLLACCLLVPAGAALPLRSEAESPGAGWQDELVAAHSMLRADDYAGAERSSRALIQELIRSLKGGPGANDLVAVALAQLAVAEAGLAASDPLKIEAAVWHLEMARAFNPRISEPGFGDFGAAGERLVAAAERQAARLMAKGDALPVEPVAGLTPPRPIETPYMVFRASREVLEALDPGLHAQLVIEHDGRVRTLEVGGRLDNPAPVVLSLELLRGWRFRPATLGATPVAVRYALDLPLTEGVARRAGWDLELWAIACRLAGSEWEAARAASADLVARLVSAPATAARDVALARARELLALAEERLAGR